MALPTVTTRQSGRQTPQDTHLLTPEEVLKILNDPELLARKDKEALSANARRAYMLGRTYAVRFNRKVHELLKGPNTRSEDIEQVTALLKNIRDGGNGLVTDREPDREGTSPESNVALQRQDDGVPRQSGLPPRGFVTWNPSDRKDTMTAPQLAKPTQAQAQAPFQRGANHLVPPQPVLGLQVTSPMPNAPPTTNFLPSIPRSITIPATTTDLPPPPSPIRNNGAPTSSKPKRRPTNRVGKTSSVTTPRSLLQTSHVSEVDQEGREEGHIDGYEDMTRDALRALHKERGLGWGSNRRDMIRKLRDQDRRSARK